MTDRELMQEVLDFLVGGNFAYPTKLATDLRERLAQPEHHDPIGDAQDKLIAEKAAQQEPEFFTHCVDQPYDWSEWVCPDPKSYLFKCCDCGLVHEAEFGVVRYKSETEREECDMVNDANLQAVFRMRRSEQWLPSDTAHRAGGMPMEQPTQRTWVGLTVEEIIEVIHPLVMASMADEATDYEIARAIEAKLREKNA